MLLALALAAVAVLCLISMTAATIVLGTTLATVLLDTLVIKAPPPSDSQNQLRVDLSKRRERVSRNTNAGRRRSR